MGISITILVSTFVSREKWKSVYGETIGLARKLGIAEMREKPIHGHKVNCLAITEEGEWNGEKGWWAVADYENGDSCEGFFFPKELGDPKTGEPTDILAKYAHNIDLVETDATGDNYRRIWGDKTQGHSYHLSLLAVGCLVQDRLGDDAYVYGAINAGQCREAVRMANRHLETPIRVPPQCDADRWMERVSSLSLVGVDRIRVAVALFLGRKDSLFGNTLRDNFQKELLYEYWEEEMNGCTISQIGFQEVLLEYLNLGFDEGKLYDLVKFSLEEEHGYREKFFRIVADAKLHIRSQYRAEQSCLGADDPRPYGIGRMLYQFFGLDLMAEMIDESETTDEYDIYKDSQLQFYKNGNAIIPQIVEKLCSILDFADTLLQGKEYRKNASESVMKKGSMLVAIGEYRFDLRDKDWERIFYDLEKNPGAFLRYYPLFMIDTSNREVCEDVTALIINDELYNYAREIQSRKRKETAGI